MESNSVMKNHGKNRERSRAARKKQSEGKHKHAQWLKWRKKITEYWREYWDADHPL